MSEPKISVILPVYNVEDYLTETLDCILKQSMIDDLEVIMVDDGSSDESRYIIERYALDYDNFHSYHKTNEGQAITRNRALELAEGDYVHFLDSDDYLPPNAYETLYDIALRNDSDFVISNVLRFARYNVWEDILFKNSYKDISGVIDSTSLDEMPSLIWDTITCNKLYKREFLLSKGIRFPEKKISFEDIPFSLESYILADSISITPEVCYYWRFRNDHTSTTQQDSDVSSIMDRLEILRSIHEMLVRYNVSQNIADAQYLKWISHDLKFFIKRFDHYPEAQHRQLFDEIRELVMLIPDYIIESLNTYKKVIFKMVLNNDFDSFVQFAPLENELFDNPHIPEFITGEYESYFDFKKAAKDEELMAEVTDISNDDTCIFIGFNAKVSYLPDDCEREIYADLLQGDDRYPLEVNGYQIAVPFDFIKDKKHSRIEMCCKFDGVEKTCTLKNRHRKSIEFEDFYLDLNIGMNSHLYIDIMERCDNSIEINDIHYQNGKFVLNGTSKAEIGHVYIENVITFDRIDCPVNRSGEMAFEISQSELMDAAVKKWEINSKECPNSIRVSKSFEFYRNHAKIRFINSRNKILIENDVYNPIEELDELNSLNKELKSQASSFNGEKSRLVSENKKLKKENAELNERISQFKSRKVVKIADKLKLN